MRSSIGGRPSLSVDRIASVVANDAPPDRGGLQYRGRDEQGTGNMCQPINRCTLSKVTSSATDSPRRTRPVQAVSTAFPAGPPVRGRTESSRWLRLTASAMTSCTGWEDISVAHACHGHRLLPVVLRCLDAKSPTTTTSQPASRWLARWGSLRLGSGRGGAHPG
jgi:hypothetical protein